jgi:V/A-type H+/Na+-transporting ATPase subunit F
MARLVVIADPETSLGFQLSGVEVVRADDLEIAATQLAQLLGDATVGLIAIGAGLAARLDDGQRRRVENSYRPVVVTLPAGGPTLGFATRREYLAALIRRAIGFHITFAEEGNGPDAPEASATGPAPRA